jgi:peptidoglycan/xylan/chitin deacetylase (PgdA/CDA1 family)
VTSHIGRPGLSAGPQSWRPPPAIAVSIGLHVAALVLWVCDTALAPALLAMVIANHAVLLICGVLRPRSQLVGRNVVRLPNAWIERGEIEITFDDGPHPDITPRVLDLLDAHGVKATFFCVGENASAHPHIVQDIIRRGHAVENHSYHHSPLFALYGMRRLAREIRTAQAVICALTGHEPQFFRAPAGFRTPLLDPVLSWHGLTYVSWTRRAYDSVRTDAHAVVRALTAGLEAGDILLLHDGAPASSRSTEPVVLSVLPLLIRTVRDRELKSVTLRAAYERESRTERG